MSQLHVLHTDGSASIIPIFFPPSTQMLLYQQRRVTRESLPCAHSVHAPTKLSYVRAVVAYAVPRSVVSELCVSHAGFVAASGAMTGNHQ
jgi:hypothetical protein